MNNEDALYINLRDHMLNALQNNLPVDDLNQLATNEQETQLLKELETKFLYKKLDKQLPEKTTIIKKNKI